MLAESIAISGETMYEMGSTGISCMEKNTSALIRSIIGIMMSRRFAKYFNKAFHYLSTRVAGPGLSPGPAFSE